MPNTRLTNVQAVYRRYLQVVSGRVGEAKDVSAMEEVREVRRLVEAHGRLGAIARHEDRRLVEIVAA